MVWTPFHMPDYYFLLLWWWVYLVVWQIDATSVGYKNIAKRLFLPPLFMKERRLCDDFSFSTCGLNFGTIFFPSLLHCYLIFRLELWTWLQTPSLINYANYWNPFLYRHNSQGSLPYACLREIRPTPSKDPPMMQIVSILILQPRSPAPTTTSVLLLCSQLCCCCVLHGQMLFALFVLVIVPNHNSKGSHFKSGLALMRLDATKKMILNLHRVGGCLSTCRTSPLIHL